MAKRAFVMKSGTAAVLKSLKDNPNLARSPTLANLVAIKKPNKLALAGR